MKNVLMLLGALFCLTVIGGGLTGCTAEVTVGFTEYTIYLNPMGGEVEYGSFKGTIGGTRQLPIPTKDGYWFDGWYEETNDGRSTYDVGAYYTVWGNSTLYAAWRPK